MSMKVWRKGSSGASAMEYGMIAAFVSIAFIGGYSLLQAKAGQTFEAAAQQSKAPLVGVPQNFDENDSRKGGPNRRPVVPVSISIPAQEVNIPFSVSIAGFSDPEGEVLTFQKSGPWPSWANVTLNSGVMRVFGTPGGSGVWSDLSILVSDDKSEVKSPLFDIVVYPAQNFEVLAQVDPSNANVVGYDKGAGFGEQTVLSPTRFDMRTFTSSPNYTFLTYEGDVTSDLLGKSVTCNATSYAVPSTIVSSRAARDQAAASGTPTLAYYSGSNTTAISWPAGTSQPTLSDGQNYTCTIE